MTHFQSNKIHAETIGIIDIGTSKIRVAICAIKNREIELLGYGEKRQDQKDILMQEIQNIESVCENIASALRKAEVEAGISPANLIINIPTPEIFLEHSKLNYIRDIDQAITQAELYEIMSHIESAALKKHYKTIKNNSGYSESELKLIISNIAEINIDGEATKKLLNENPKEISVSLTNVFLPENKYEIVEHIENFLEKKILQIIPIEYSLSHLFPDNEEMVMIDIGCSHTSLVIQRNNTIIGAKKLAFGINDLIKTISKNYHLSQAQIIDQMDSSNFPLEKAQFLDIFHDILAISIEEIIGKDICPHHFFMSGGGANTFVKDYLSNVDINRRNLKVPKKIEFVIPQVSFMDPDDTSWVDTAKSNINIFSLIRSALDFVKKDKTQVERMLKQVIANLEN